MTRGFSKLAVEILDGGSVHLERWHFDRLSSPYWRFYWNATAGARVILNNRTTQLDPSRCMVIPPYTSFTARLTRPVDHFCLHFIVGPPYNRVEPGIYTFPATAHLRATIREITRLARTSGGASAQLAVLYLLLAHTALVRIPAAKVTLFRSDRRVAAAIRIMDNSLSAPPALAALARRLGFHTNTFIRLFKEATGRTPQAFFTALRIDHACIRLCGSTTSIKEIAAETGFCDACHFSRVFRRICGVSPARFRIIHTTTISTTVKESAWESGVHRGHRTTQAQSMPPRKRGSSERSIGSPYGNRTRLLALRGPCPSR